MDVRTELEKMKEMGWTSDDFIELFKIIEEDGLDTLNLSENYKVFSKICNKYLVELGISLKLTGFRYLRDAILENLQYDVFEREGLMKLCNRVGKKYRKDGRAVYIDIVCALKSGWKEYGMSVWKDVLENDIVERPTVSEIITILSERIRNNEMSIDLATELDNESEKLNRRKLKKACEAYLEKLEISSELKGYCYLREAVLEYIKLKQDAMVYGTAKAIYKTIAKKYGDIEANVARTIKYVIIKSWRESEEAVWKETFGFVSNETYPSNCEFISALSLLVRNIKV